MIADYDIERCVIGSLMMFESAQDKIQIIEPDDFSVSQLRNIFVKIQGYYIEHGKGDPIIFGHLLNGEEKRVAMDAAQAVVSAASFDEYLRIFKETASKRRISNAVHDLIISEECDAQSLQQVIDDERNHKVLMNAEERSKANIAEYIENIDKPKDVIKTGFGMLDKCTSGLQKGLLCIIGARPSTGKTTFAINIAMNQAKYNKSVLFYSLEMTSDMIYDRMMSAQLKIPYNKMVSRKLSSTDVQDIKDSMTLASKNNRLSVIDDVYTIENICSQIIDCNPDVCIIDFIQIVDSTQRFENVRVKTDYIAKELKRVAKKMNCLIIVLSQLTRAGKDEPTMSDLKESGGLEQDGDYIFLLHRPYVLDKNNPEKDPSETQLLLDKNKVGYTGKLDFKFDGVYQQFYELDKWHDRNVDYGGIPFEA